MDDDKNFYERLILVPGCGPKKAERIIGKLNLQKTLTETEQRYCSEADPDRFSCPDEAPSNDASVIDKSLSQEDDTEIRLAIQKLMNKQNIMYLYMVASAILAVFLATLVGPLLMGILVIIGSPIIAFIYLHIEQEKKDRWRHASIYHSGSINRKEKDRLAFSEERLEQWTRKYGHEIGIDLSTSQYASAWAIVIGLWVGGYYYIHSGVFDDSTLLIDKDAPRNVMDEPEIKQFMRKNMRKGADGLYYYEPKK